MTDRVIEIRLIAPRPDLLALLAQPEMAILRNGLGSGPFRASAERGGEFRLTREITDPDQERSTKEELLLGAGSAADAVMAFAKGDADLVLGGTFLDLPETRRARIPREAVRYDPASGLFGLVALTRDGPLGKPEARRLLSQAIDRETFVTVLGVPALAPRATLLEPGLDGVPAVVAPAWQATAYAARIAALQPQAAHIFGQKKPVIRVAMPEGGGADLLLQLLRRNWGQLGFTVERAASAAGADFALIDEVAPSSSPAWFVRRFRCGVVSVCNAEADHLMEAARQTPVPAQRYALLMQAAARIDDAQLFLALTAPVRWSLVSQRIQGFAGNRYARHTLTDLQAKPSGGE
jgi:peptide/nickel transport system substrate-binding protein